MLWTCLPLCHGSCLVRSVYKKLNSSKKPTVVMGSPSFLSTTNHSLKAESPIFWWQKNGGFNQNSGGFYPVSSDPLEKWFSTWPQSSLRGNPIRRLRVVRESYEARGGKHFGEAQRMSRFQRGSETKDGVWKRSFSLDLISSDHFWVPCGKKCQLTLGV